MLASGLAIAPSRIHGRGCFATIRFARRKKIAEYTGERITNAEAARTTPPPAADQRARRTVEHRRQRRRKRHALHQPLVPAELLSANRPRPTARPRAARHPPGGRDHSRLRRQHALRPQALFVRRAGLPRHDQQIAASLGEIADFEKLRSALKTVPYFLAVCCAFWGLEVFRLSGYL